MADGEPMEHLKKFLEGVTEAALHTVQDAGRKRSDAIVKAWMLDDESEYSQLLSDAMSSPIQAAALMTALLLSIEDLMQIMHPDINRDELVARWIILCDGRKDRVVNRLKNENL